MARSLILDGYAIADEYRMTGSFGELIVLGMNEPMTAHAFTRATYTNISKMHFTWRRELCGDVKIGSEFMVVEVYRSKG